MSESSASDSDHGESYTQNDEVQKCISIAESRLKRQCSTRGNRSFQIISISDFGCYELQLQEAIEELSSLTTKFVRETAYVVFAYMMND